MSLKQSTTSSSLDAPVTARRIVQLVRVSSKSQADKLTPENQRAILDKMLAQGSGVLVSRIEDGAVGMSGGNALKDRPDLLKLFSLLKDRAVDEVQVVALDRLSRSDDMIERAMILQAVRDAGAIIRTADGTITDPSTQTGELMGSLSLLFATWEKAKIKDRTLAGRLRSVAAGKPGAGNVPYALRYDRDKQGWVVVADEAETVRLMFNLAATGLGVEKIGQHVGNLGKRTRRGIPFNRAAVRLILRHSAYTGTWVQAYGGQTFTASVPAIIERDLFDTVQAALTGRRACGGAPYTLEVLCRGVVFCSCGRPMHVTVKNTRRTTTAYHPIYQCASRRSPGESCGNPSFRTEEADRAVWEAVARKLSDPALLTDALASREASPDTSTWEGQIAGAKKALDKVSKRAAALAEARADGVISDGDYRQRMDAYQREKANLERTITAATQGITDAGRWQSVRTALTERLTALRAKLDGASVPFGIRRDALLALVPRALGCGITLWPDGRITVKAVLWTDPTTDGGGGRGCHLVGSTRSATIFWTIRLFQAQNSPDLRLLVTFRRFGLGWEAEMLEVLRAIGLP
jgi:site-specific DNA recombinase